MLALNDFRAIFGAIAVAVYTAMIANNGRSELATIIRHVAAWVEGGCSEDPRTITQELVAWSERRLKA